MKFGIITHAEHKIQQDSIYAYKPYVKEMNLWINYVDEVEIVAPVSNETIINSIESSYKLENRFSVINAESNDSNASDGILKQVQHDGALRHSEHSEAISSKKQIATSHTSHNNKSINLTQIPSFDITSLKSSIKAITVIPKILWTIYKAMQRADHIHLRCPGNIGLLGCFVQILYPSKPKTVKYAGNWDPKSKQPISYRLQKWIISNTFLTKKCKVLVYGNWPNQSKNIIPFFTASYSEKEIEEVEIRTINRHPELDSGSHGQKSRISNQVENDEPNRNSLEKGNLFVENTETSYQVGNDESKRHNERSEVISQNEQIATSHTPRNDKYTRHSTLDTESHESILKFIYVGGLTPGKQPLLSVKTIHELKKKGYNVQLDIYGEGKERNKIEDYIVKNKLQNNAFLHGNQTEQVVKEAYKKAHFLLFISKSEGWPKVVAEAMFWGCVPITSDVSCIKEMLGNGRRGTIVKPSINSIVKAFEFYIKNKDKYREHAKNAMIWSRQFTLEKFELEIKQLLISSPSLKEF